MDTEQDLAINFAYKMISKIELRHNRYVPMGWRTMYVKRLVALLKGELLELEEAMKKDDKIGAQDEAIDIANYALFIHEVLK